VMPVAEGKICVPEASWVPAERLKFVNRFVVERADSCISCGLCASLCPNGVHKRVEGHASILPPYHQRCIGPSCSSNEYYCVKHCPTSSLSVRASETFPALRASVTSTLAKGAGSGGSERT